MLSRNQTEGAQIVEKETPGQTNAAFVPDKVKIKNEIPQRPKSAKSQNKGEAKVAVTSSPAIVVSSSSADTTVKKERAMSAHVAKDERTEKSKEVVNSHGFFSYFYVSKCKCYTLG